MSPILAVVTLMLALTTAFFIQKKFSEPALPRRFAAIDGLRGYLALFVFVHHASIWNFYLQTGEWSEPPSRFYSHLGSSSVTLFFMITGFLFYSKLLAGRATGIDWTKFFVARVLRLTPLYLLAMLLLFTITAVLSKGVLIDSIPKLIQGMTRWLGFTLLGAPDLNGINHTNHILAGVSWSLRYEWFFYLSLPILAFTVGILPPLGYIVLGVLSIVALYFWHPQSHHFYAFLGGMIAAVLVRSKEFCAFSETKIAGVLIVLALICVVTFYPSAKEIYPKLLLMLAFALIAGGNGLFGILVSQASRTLGDMAYSIYLLHGAMLTVVFNFVIGMKEAKHMTMVSYSVLIAALTPLLILSCSVTFRYIESPPLRHREAITYWLKAKRKHLNRLE